MKRRGHLTIGFIFTIPFIILGFFVDPWLALKFILFWFLFSLGADMDFAFKIQHRNFFFHSIIIPVAFWLCFFKTIKFESLIPIYVWSIHLLCDIYQAPRKKPIGTYCIHYRSGNALTGKQTKMWLGMQGVIGIIIGIIIIMLMVNHDNV